jgi:hypothetical protein
LQGGAAKEKIQHAPAGEFRRVAKAAVLPVEGFFQITERALESVARRRAKGSFPRRHGSPVGPGAQNFHGARAFGDEFFALLGPAPPKGAQHVREARPPVAVLGRKISAAIKRLEIRREPRAQRPAAMAGERLHIGHVNAIDVGPFLAVHLDGNKFFVEQRGDIGVLKRFVRHHMAPVAGRISDAEKNRLLFGTRLGESRLTPRKPVDGIVRMLAEVGRLLVREGVGHGREGLKG